MGGLSKVASARHEDLTTFISRQTFRGSQKVGKVFLMMGLIIGMILVELFFPVAVLLFLDGGSTYLLPDVTSPSIALIVVLTVLSIAILFSLCWCCGRSIMSCRDEERHPCCVPLGRRLDDDK